MMKLLNKLFKKKPKMPPVCPTCNGRINTRPDKCHLCGSSIGWCAGMPLSPPPPPPPPPPRIGLKCTYYETHSQKTGGTKNDD